MGMTHRRATLRLGLATVRVLVIGSGAREHALLLALRNDPDVESLAIAPGNAGTTQAAGEGTAPIRRAAIAALSPVAAVELARAW